MKRILIIVIIMLMLALPACQPTPEEQVITQKDDLEEMIQNTAAPTDNGETQTPETEEAENSDEPQPDETEELALKYQDHFEFQDGTFTVDIDAVVDEPDGSVSVAKVEPYLFTEKDADRAVEVLMGNKPIYEYEFPTMTAKATFQNKIIQLESVIANIKSDTTIDENTKSSLIASYNTWIMGLENLSTKAALDLPEWNQVTTEFVDRRNKAVGLHVKADTGKIWPAIFSILVYSDGKTSTMSFGDDDSIFVYEGVLEIDGDIKGMETTFTQALSLAEETLEMMGINGLVLNTAELGTFTVFRDVEILENKYVPKCYIFNFEPQINGIRTQVYQTCKGFEKDNVEYEAIWPGEKIRIVIDDSGLIGYSHGYPGVVTEIINENVEVLGFDEIMDIFEQQIFYKGVWIAPNVSYSKLTIERIKMSMFRLKKKDKDEYLYVPVWDFIGSWETNNYSTEEEKEVSFLTINAVNGSVIDRNLGY